MMKRMMVVVCLLFCLGGCVSKEMQTLALGIHGYQLKQELVIKSLIDDDTLSEEEKKTVVEDAESLSRATGVLSELLGEPR